MLRRSGDTEGLRYQIKCRRLATPRGSRQLGFIRRPPERPFGRLAASAPDEVIAFGAAAYPGLLSDALSYRVWLLAIGSSELRTLGCYLVYDCLTMLLNDLEQYAGGHSRLDVVLRALPRQVLRKVAISVELASAAAY